jgi:hypothetical protein
MGKLEPTPVQLDDAIRERSSASVFVAGEADTDGPRNQAVSA